MAGLLQQVSTAHPRLLGSREQLQALSRSRPEPYARVVQVARQLMIVEGSDSHSMRGKLMSMGLVSAIENDATLAREAVEMAQRVILNQPVRVGHVGFGNDCALLAFIYDLCHEAWVPADRERYYAYVKEAREKNMAEEPSVFHNGWYGMKMGGFILACLATMHENPRAEPFFEEIHAEYLERAAPGLKFAGAGGGFGEGYYTHYWIFEWILTCQCLQVAAGIDYFATAPAFYKHRAIASMFEMYPTFREGGTRRTVPCGDSGGRLLHPERDKSLAAMRILCSHYRDDPAHQMVQAYTEQVPKVSFDHAAWLDFLWKDPTVKAGDLSKFKRSHFSPAAGYVSARGSWDEQSAYLFFHCGRRFTSHQHLDMNHFVLFKYEELLGDGGAYDSFDSPHCINYYLRTIAHNTLLIHNPAEKFPAYMRAAGAAVNDGGQKYPWIGSPWGHNGGAWDVAMWEKNPELGEFGVMLAYEDTGDYMYCAGDATNAYAASKLECFTRQIVYIRPDTFVIFDRVRSVLPSFKKTFLLHAMSVPWQADGQWLINHGYGLLFVQTLLPEQAETKLVLHDDQYVLEGQSYRFSRSQGPAPECRMEISPSTPAKQDYFLHVLRTAEYNRRSMPPTTMRSDGDTVTVMLGADSVTFEKSRVAGSVTINGKSRTLCAATLQAGGKGYVVK